MIPSGALHHIHEILDNPQLHSASVRVLGELIVFDARRQRAVITHNGRNLAVDTSLLGPIAFAVGSTYQFIGEVQVETNHTEPASSHVSIGGAGGTSSATESALAATAAPPASALTAPEGRDRARLVLRARVVHEADSVDRDLRTRVLELRRAFLDDPRFVRQPVLEHL